MQLLINIDTKTFILFFLISSICLTHSYPAEENNNELSISVIGDVMCHDKQLYAAWDKKCKCYKFNDVFMPVKKYMSESDWTIANFETTLPGKKKLYSGYPQFGSPDSLAKALKDNGVDVLTLANNHSIDKKKKGVLRTIDTITKLGFYSLGTYKNKKDFKKRRILILEKKGIRLALLNYTYGTNGIKIPKGTVINMIKATRIKNDLALARKMKPDAIIVLYHFGSEYKRYSSKYQQKWVRFAIHNGADVVLGGHPHVLQPFGVKKIKDKFGHTKNRLIAWSLGNFVSNQQRHYTDGGMIFNFSLRRNPDTSSSQKLLFSKIDYVPVWVYLDKSKKQHSYHVLPVNEYLNNKQKIKLPKYSLKMMNVFYKDTTSHLKKSLDSVKSFNKN